MACKLAGTPLQMRRGADILSDGIVPGAVQVSADGQPIVMLADHQTTGGYAKIATVISADLPALAQLRPGQRVCFTFVTPARAVQAARQQADKLLAAARENAENDRKKIVAEANREAVSIAEDAMEKLLAAQTARAYDSFVNAAEGEESHEQ